MSSTVQLDCSALDITVDGRILVSQLNMSVLPGTVTCVLGRNGTGKSLTMHTLAGLRKFRTGEVNLNHQPLHALTRRYVAQHLAFVAQDIEEPFSVTALEYAVSGRHPHIDFWHWESEQDYDIAQAALADVDLAEFSGRSVQTLSGGERRRLAIAMALTQTPVIFVMDEPINHLDPQHQLQVLKLLRSKADAGCAVIMSLHDPNLAEQFSDYALLLFGDGSWLHGDNRTLLSSETMTRLYHTPMQQLDWQGKRLFIGV